MHATVDAMLVYRLCTEVCDALLHLLSSKCRGKAVRYLYRYTVGMTKFVTGDDDKCNETIFSSIIMSLTCAAHPVEQAAFEDEAQDAGEGHGNDGERQRHHGQLVHGGQRHVAGGGRRGRRSILGHWGQIVVVAVAAIDVVVIVVVVAASVDVVVVVAAAASVDVVVVVVAAAASVDVVVVVVAAAAVDVLDVVGVVAAAAVAAAAAVGLVGSASD